MEEPNEPLKNKDFRHYYSFIREYYSVENISSELMGKISVILVNFKSKVLERLNNCHRNYEKMSVIYSKWLSKSLLDDDLEINIKPNSTVTKPTLVEGVTKSKGRPKAQYEELSERGKRRRTLEIRQTTLEIRQSFRAAEL